MKKIIFGSAAAICAAVGFSSFKTVHSTNTYYWFELQTAKQRTKAIGTLKNSDLSILYQTTTTPTPPSVDPCSGSTNWCLAGFSSAQITAGGGIATSAGAITPAAGAAYTKP